MTPQDHNKVIGIMHLVWGGMNALILLFLVPLFLFIIPAVGSDPNAPPGVVAIFGAVGVFILLLGFILSIPPLLAGYGVLKRREWGRVASMVSSCIAALSFPFGTALCVYTLWFMLGQGEALYKGGARPGVWNNAALGAQGTSTFDWEARQHSPQARREGEYQPPPQPPDWRG